MSKINAFLEKGKNKTLIKIIDGVVIGLLSVATIYIIARILSASTAADYLKTVGRYFLILIVVGGVDFLLILFTKPLFGFTSFVENHKARKTLKAREKASKLEIERQAQETLKAARAARKAEQAKQ